METVVEEISGSMQCAPSDLAFVTVCVDSLKDGEFSGRLWSRYLPEEVDFVSTARLALAIDKLCDVLDFPQSYMKKRNFIPAVRPIIVPQAEKIVRIASERDKRKRSVYSKEHKPGGLLTLYIHVQFRQHVSMQGRIYHGKHAMLFRSALELLHVLAEIADAYIPRKGINPAMREITI